MAKKGTSDSNPSGLFFPSNIVPSTKAVQEKWKKEWVESIRRYSYFCFNNKDDQNFRYAQGRVSDSEFAHISQLYFNAGTKKALPSKIRQVNAIAHILNRVIGKVDAQELKFTANAVNEDAINKKLDKLADHVTEKSTRFVRQQAGVTELLGQPLVEGDDLLPEDPAAIEKINLTNFHVENEINVSLGLKYLLKNKKTHLQYKFAHQMLYNYLITGKMAFDNFIEFSNPDGRSIDPRYLIYDLEIGSPFIQDGRFNGYWFAATPQQITDMCPEMDEDDLKKIDELSKMFAAGKQMATTTSDFWFQAPDTNMYYLNCYKIYFKAVKWTKCIIEPNKYDEDNPHVFYVDDKTKPDLKKGQTIEHRPVNVWFECTRFGEDVYYQCREIPNQQRPLDEPSESISPIVGIVDPMPCVVDLLQPLQALRIECFYSLERLIGQAKGKILIIDEAMEEDGQDNLYNMMTFGVYKVNSAKEGEQQLGIQPVAPKEIDMGLSTAVNDLMRMVSFLDANMALITGINEPAQGIIKSDTGLGVVQAAQEAAQLTLQPYYNVFYTVVEQVLQAQCNLMKRAWGGKKKIGWVLGDRAREFFSLDPDCEWNLDDYGIYVENGVSSEQEKQLILKMAGQLMPTVQEPQLALSILKMFRAASGAEAEEIFTKGIQALDVIKAKQQQFESAQSDKALQIQASIAEQKANTEKEKNQTDIQVATINQQAETERTQMKLQHKEDEDTVRYKNEIGLNTAKHILKKDDTEHQTLLGAAFAEPEQAAAP